MQGDIYLGLDVGTQSLKAVCVSHSGDVVHRAKVVYDTALPHFETTAGMHVDRNTGRVTVPVQVWFDALELVFNKLKNAGLDFAAVRAIGGAAQQHGSIYWNDGSRLGELHPNRHLGEQVNELLSLSFAPIWADSTTSKECLELEELYGGPLELSRLTGSRAYERFTVNQIAKVYKDHPEAYAKTKHITLISNGFASVLTGKIVEMDEADAGGTNCYDYTNKKWLDHLARICPGLQQRLGLQPMQGRHVVGEVSRYFVARFGFSKGCHVAAFTGDNPASLVGICGFRRAPTVIISLGTSDTVFVADCKSETKPQLQGHVFPHPLWADLVMLLLCYKNGSYVRERVKGKIDWVRASQLLLESRRRSKRSSFLLGFFFDKPEITPNTKLGQGEFIYRYDVETGQVSEAKGLGETQKLLCCIESRFVAMVNHIKQFGIDIAETAKIVVTGGGAQSSAILEIIADIFQTEVFTAVVQDSASLGAAKLAIYGLHGTAVGPLEADLASSATPKELYPKEVFQKYHELESQLMTQFHTTQQ